MSDAENTKGKGKAFFDQGDQVAETGNWDYAIEMYTEGIKREPDDMERGHKKLREVSLKRKAQGGKGPGFGDKRKHPTSTKDPTENLGNAAYLLAKDPGNVTFMEAYLKAAKAAQQVEVVRWMSELLIETQQMAKKPSKRICVVVTNACEEMEQYDLAVRACGLAVQSAPNDADLEQRLGQLGARLTIQKGRYGEEGDFTKGVKDMDKQKELMQKDAFSKDAGYLEQQILKTKKEYEENPQVAGKINAYADALLKIEDEEHENQAIALLEKAYQESGAYQFKMRVGDIKMRQMSRQFRELKQAGKPEEAKQAALEQLKFEIQEYTERTQQYPTDLGMKYELGRRLFLAGKYDDAIGVLQQAQRDPRRFVVVANYLGQAFMKKQWWQEAADTFDRVLQGDIPEERAKDIRYNLGQCHEAMGNLKEAQEQFSTVAQTDFNFRDVRERLEAVRQKIKDSSS